MLYMNVQFSYIYIYLQIAECYTKLELKALSHFDCFNY